ncbi:beta-galactosidase GalB [Thermoflavifilum thermophilum]|uniref:beta-galactosidase GalB n=1 Tax=Thermoflavifilum thermophilum TaxID=1393122 RepID=UPI001FEBADB2|nr:beta-galactosidase GalB [Thermoflavifilum thermophilum]
MKENFDAQWRFHLGDPVGAEQPGYDDHSWRLLNLPHDWSIEGTFSRDNPATPGGGALPGGVGWYRKTFTVSEADRGKLFFIDFDGVYMDSRMWINGHYLGERPYGYSSFEYELTPYLHIGGKNVIAVRVDNSHQPNSRWYSGSGIYRNVWLIKTHPCYIDHWGVYVTTPHITNNEAVVRVQTTIRNRLGSTRNLQLQTRIEDATGKTVAENSVPLDAKADSLTVAQQLQVSDPHLWSTDDPYLYRVVSRIVANGQTIDDVITPLGIRYFHFDPRTGFSLNGKPMKIWGVCDHHDLGCLGAAIHERALERQLQMLKKMGVNGFRTSHNPPAPELLDLCDKLGILVMDEAFDCWKRGKNPYDYHIYWDQWHRRDLEDMIRRDRNHPSVIIWSIGNEIPDQWDSAGADIARELVGIVKSLDTTRPITSALNDPESPRNSIAHSGALDLIGYNYDVGAYDHFPENFPGMPFIATETTSALETRGHYDMPSDSIRVWPPRGNSHEKMNSDYTCSAYDNCCVPWGNLHEDALRAIMDHPFASGMFIWTGWDYLGEPTPYPWPARSSYFGIIDLAGFPKDIYYMYQSVWTQDTVLHIFPHWNWKPGDSVDVWAFYNHADEVELFLNGKSLGKRHKEPGQFHVMWRVAYEPGELKAVSYHNGQLVKTAVVRTAGAPYRIELIPDRSEIHADGRDLSFVTVKVVDQHGTLVPDADQLIHFDVQGAGFIAGTDNGNEIDHTSFPSHDRHAFNGLALVVVQSDGKKGTIQVKATAEGLQPAFINLSAQ